MYLKYHKNKIENNFEKIDFKLQLHFHHCCYIKVNAIPNYNLNLSILLRKPYNPRSHLQLDCVLNLYLIINKDVKYLE